MVFDDSHNRPCMCPQLKVPEILCGTEPPSPWDYLRNHRPDVSLFVRVFDNDMWGLTVWTPNPEIHLGIDLGPRNRRSTLAHELVHVALGQPCRVMCPDNERRVVAATARWLLPDLKAIAGALAECDMFEAAKLLGVNRVILTDRLDSLTLDERELIRCALRSQTLPADGSRRHGGARAA